MKTLQDAYQDFNLEQLIVARLQGTAQALNAYTECCGRYCGQYYLTGDTVRLNELGGIDFIGRADDVITTSGYRVGPFDVESTLLECEEVLESAVVGKPDPERTEIVKAFVVLKAQFSASPALEQKLQQYVRSRLSKHAYPKEIEFVEALPKTSSGKIQRNILKQQEIDKQRLLEKVS